MPGNTSVDFTSQQCRFKNNYVIPSAIISEIDFSNFSNFIHSTNKFKDSKTLSSMTSFYHSVNCTRNFKNNDIVKNNKWLTIYCQLYDLFGNKIVYLSNADSLELKVNMQLNQRGTHKIIVGNYQSNVNATLLSRVVIGGCLIFFWVVF